MPDAPRSAPRPGSLPEPRPEPQTASRESSYAASHAASVSEVVVQVGADVASGLSSDEASARLARDGPNRLRVPSRKAAWRILVDQFRSLVAGLLAAAAGVSLLLGDRFEAVAIAVVLAINAAIGFVTEHRATRAMEALARLVRVQTRVRRDGGIVVVDAEAVVVGDIIVCEGGDLVPADARIVRASALEVDESSLTGESLPVEKDPAAVAADSVLAERTSMVFAGTHVTRGSAEVVVTATGRSTQLGRVAELVAGAEDEVTPIEVRLATLGRRLVWLVLGVAMVVAAVGVVTGRPLDFMFKVGVALAVAAIPEGLPIVATLALARGVSRMAKRHALVNRLASVETLGGVSVLCVDKTGTLTRNEMRLDRLLLPDGDIKLDEADPAALSEAARSALRAAVWASNASVSSEDGRLVGDPTETALLAAARQVGFEPVELHAAAPRRQEWAFDPVAKRMAVAVGGTAGLHVFVKGAPEAVLATCDIAEEEVARWSARMDAAAAEGLRVLALATRRLADADGSEALAADLADIDPYAGLTMLGMVALRDPPREDAAEAVARLRRAGVAVVMITGDQPTTARAIAHAVGVTDAIDADVVVGRDVPHADDMDEATRARLAATRVFARVTPGQKLDLVALHQAAGHVVAMTGDGVNDAPALKKADIGVAMGRRGTEVAKEAADIVLQDDALATIGAAIEQGRTIFRNIRRSVTYLLSCNVGEVIVVGVGVSLAGPLPLLPLQVLLLNLLTDVFPALALGFGKPEADVMQRPPVDASKSLLTRGHWRFIASYGAIMAAATLGVFALMLGPWGAPAEQATTAAFLTLALAQVVHVFNMTTTDGGRPDASLFRDGWVWASLLVVGLLMLAVFAIPVLAQVFDIVPLSPGAYGAVLAGASVVGWAGLAHAWWLRRRA